MTFLIIFLLVVVAMFMACLVITSKIFDYIFMRSTEQPKSTAEAMAEYADQEKETLQWLAEQPKETLEIKSKDGLLLKGTLYHLHENNDKVILAIHGYHGTGLTDMGQFARMYERLVYDVLMIDQRACGTSEGEFTSFGYHEKEDGILWCQKLIEEYGENVEIVLHGISSGAATVCNMSGHENLPKQVDSIISDCTYDSIKTQLRHSIHTQTQLPVEFTLWLLDMYCKKRVGFSFKDNKQTAALEKAKVPMLFIHGDKDDYVPYDMLEFVYDSCASTRKVQAAVPNATYKLSFLVDPAYYEREVKKLLGV